MKAIIIDDEQLAINYLEHQLRNIEDIEIIGKFTDPIMGKESIEKNDVEIVFLDIHIPEINGIQLAEQILEMKPELHIVFVTAYGEYAVDAFELNALDYVLKPVDKQRLLKTIQRIKTMMVTASAHPNANKLDTLYISTLQEVTISVGEHMIPLRWRTTKVEQLFLYLVQHRGQTINKTAIIDLLWPELESDKAYQQMYTAIYYIRKTLASYKKYFEINSTTEGYRLRLEHAVLDVDQFDQFFESDIVLSSETISKYEHTIKMFSGVYLQEYDYVWAESERQRLQFKWVQVALKMMNWYYTHEKYDKAMTLGLEICRRYPLEEEAYFHLMKVFAALGRDSSVHMQYDQLKTLLYKELQEQPSLAITEWYDRWRQRNQE